MNKILIMVSNLSHYLPDFSVRNNSHGLLGYLNVFRMAVN